MKSDILSPIFLIIFTTVGLEAARDVGSAGRLSNAAAGGTGRCTALHVHPVHIHSQLTHRALCSE